MTLRGKGPTLDVTVATKLLGELLQKQTRDADIIIRVRRDGKHREAGLAFRVSHATGGKEVYGVGSTLSEAVEDYLEALVADA